MKINKQLSPLPTIIIIGVAAAAIAVGVYSYINYGTANSDSSTNDAPVEAAPERLSDEDAANKKAYIEAHTSTTKDGEVTSGTTEGTSGDTSGASDRKISIVPTQQGDTVIVSTKINGVGDGTCTLTVESSSKTYTDEAEVIYQPSHSTCAGFNVPISKLGKGSWDISISATSLSGSTARSTVSLEVT